MNQGPRPQPSYVKHLLMIAVGLSIVLLILVLKGQLQPARKSLAQSVLADAPRTSGNCRRSFGKGGSDCLFHGPNTHEARIDRTSRIGKSCPAPTVKDDAGNCVLDHDVVLDQTLALDSFVTLDCKGHKLTPSQLGSGTTGTNRSVPETGIVLHSAFGVTIQNCDLEGFDFGLFLVNNKMPKALEADAAAVESRRNKILNNTINSRFQDIHLLASDNNRINGNKLSTAPGNAVGVVSWRPLSDNIITNNTVQIGQNIVLEDLLKNAPIFPGGDYIPGGVFLGGDGITLWNIPDHIKATVENETFSFPADRITRSKGNLIEGNTIDGPPDFSKGIAAGESQDGTIIRGNTIKRTNIGILVAAEFNIDDRSVWPSNVLVEKNTVTGPAPADSLEDLINGTGFWTVGIASSASRLTVIRDNYVTGMSGAGIGIPNGSIGDVTVTHNVVTGNQVGIIFPKFDPITNQTYGAKISLNDIYGNTSFNVATFNWGSTPYTLPSELSVDGQGNYWGHTSPPGFRSSDTNSTLFTDSHSYCAPVARADSSLPATCQ